MKKLILLVTVAISTAVSAQRTPRKVIVETSSAELHLEATVVIDSVYRDYTLCEKVNLLPFGVDTSTLEMFWDYESEFTDSLIFSYELKERYVFNLRKGVVIYSNGSKREKIKINGFSYSSPYTYLGDLSSEGYIMVYTKNKNDGDESYLLYFDSNSFTRNLESDLLTGNFHRKDYKISKVTKK
jgi:hypothetical protein